MSFLTFMLLLSAIFALLIAGLIWVIRGTLRQSRSGINLSRIVCPKCGELQPSVRKPAHVKQAMWGGSTCPRCGTEMDKWGKPTSSR